MVPLGVVHPSLSSAAARVASHDSSQKAIAVSLVCMMRASRRSPALRYSQSQAGVTPPAIDTNSDRSDQ